MKIGEVIKEIRIEHQMKGERDMKIIDKNAVTGAVSAVVDAQNRLEDLFESIGVKLVGAPVSRDGSVHVYSGIKKLADIYGCELTETVRDSGEFPIMLSFIGDGIKFFTLNGDSDD